MPGKTISRRSRYESFSLAELFSSFLPQNKQTNKQKQLAIRIWFNNKTHPMLTGCKHQRCSAWFPGRTATQKAKQSKNHTFAKLLSAAINLETWNTKRLIFVHLADLCFHVLPSKTVFQTEVTSAAYCLLSLQNSLAMPVHVVHALSHAGFGLRHHLQLIQHLTASGSTLSLFGSKNVVQKLQNSNVPRWNWKWNIPVWTPWTFQHFFLKFRSAS